MFLSKVPSSANTTAMKAKSANISTQSPRPYTTYNLFFQLEREYILQHDLNVIPSLSPGEVFTLSDKDYEGPPLPAKYQNLILRSDWYRPGKALRKKRQHRATHGKIGFTDLSKRIAASWHKCEGPVKIFCARLSDIGMMKYKREIHEQKKLTPCNCTSSLATNQESQTLSNSNATSLPQSILPVMSSAQPVLALPPLPDEFTSFIRTVFTETQQSSTLPLLSNSYIIGVVDMHDDEIFNIWTGLHRM